MMNRKYLIQLSSAVLCMAAIGCASKGIQRVSPQDAKEDQSYFLMKLSFVNQDPIIQEEGCRLKLFSADGKEPIEVPVVVSDRWVMAPLPPGIYALREIYCHTDAQWTGLSIGTSTPIRIAESSVNHWGSVAMSINAAGQLNVSFQSQEQTAADLKDWFAGEGSESVHRMKSAFNGTAIRPAMLEKSPEPQGMNYSFQKGAKQPKNFKPLPIEACLKSSNEQQNPIRIGHLWIAGRFEKNKPSEVKRLKDENTFAPEIADCIENQLKTLKWTGPGFVEVTFRM